MSKFMSKQLIAIFFALLFSVAFFAPLLEARDAAKDAKDTNVSKKAKKAKKTKSGMEILSRVMDIISSFGGDAVGTAIEEVVANLQMTSEFFQGLAHDDTIDSVNFLIRNAISSLGDAARKAASDNGAGETIQPSDFGEILEYYKNILIKRCNDKSKFSSTVSNQLELVLPAVLQGLSEMYKNVVDSTGFGLSFGMLSQGTSLLAFLERPEYVSKDTFKQFVNFPEEIKHQFETIIEELVGTYVDPTQLDMMLNMAEMYAQSFARRGEHEDL